MNAAYLGNIPSALRELHQWVSWKSVPNQNPAKKPRKIPIDPKSGGPASTTDPATWGTFEQAVRCATDAQLAGIGFVFTTECGLVGVDLDHCREATTGELIPWAHQIVRRLDSYTEVSPSGSGVHVIARGTLPPGKRRSGDVEMYETGRFFTFTGDLVPETPRAIQERSDLVAQVHAELIEAKNLERSRRPRKATVARTDDEIVAHIESQEVAALVLRLWRGDSSLWGSDDRRYPSQSEADFALCGILARECGGDAERVDGLFRRSGLMREKWDEQHGEKTYGRATIDNAIKATTSGEDKRVPDSDSDEKLGVDGMIAILRSEYQAEFFHDQNMVAYVAYTENRRRKTVRVKDHQFKTWLNRNYFNATRRSMAQTLLQQVLLLIEGLAVHEGPKTSVFVRIGEKDGKIYLDLGDESWAVVEIDTVGWRVVPDSPVRFRRPAGSAALPVPVPGGTIDELRKFVNVCDEDWPIIPGWLVNGYRPRGPYGVLGLLGEQGSAKTTTVLFLRDLVDPSTMELRSTPQSVRDLMIAARNAWVLAFDNLSRIPGWLSDAICRIATGGGLTTRGLFTDDDEVIFDAQRPQVVNGIEDFIDRADLLDRSLICYAPRIASESRISLSKLSTAFVAARPRILGALMYGVSVGLRNLPTTRIDNLPRMADLALFATACEPGLGLKAGAFMHALEANRNRIVELAIDASPVAVAVRDYMEATTTEVKLTAANILQKLTTPMEWKDRPREWPRTAKAFSDALRRAAPALRAIGIEVEFQREAGGQRRRLIRMHRRIPNTAAAPASVPCVPPASLPTPPSRNAPEVSQVNAIETVGPGRTGDLNTIGTHRDGWDGSVGHFLTNMCDRVAITRNQKTATGCNADVTEGPSQPSRASPIVSNQVLPSSSAHVPRDGVMARDACDADDATRRSDLRNRFESIAHLLSRGPGDNLGFELFFEEVTGCDLSSTSPTGDQLDWVERVIADVETQEGDHV